MKPLVSALILSLNRKEEIVDCLESILSQDYDNLEVIVLDNASTDGSVEMLKTHFPQVTLIELPENVGACAGRNRALESAEGKYVFQVDNDATISPGAVSAMVERFESEGDLGIVFTRIVDPVTQRPYRPGYGHAYIEDEFYTWRFHGCAAMIRSTAIDAAGYYLPEEFFRAAEENDLAVRVLDAGFNILYMPTVVAEHKLSPRARNRGEIVYLTVRNNLAVAWKFYPLSRALVLTLWRIPHFLFKRLSRGDFAATWRFFGILRGIAGALRRRKPIAKATMDLIDALTIEPAMTLAQMRAVRTRPPEVSLSALTHRRFRTVKE